MTPRGQRILWITERYPPLTGGMAVSCARQVAGFRRRGVRIEVIAFTEPEARLEVKPVARDCGTDFHLSRSARTSQLAQTTYALVRSEHTILPFTRVVGFGANRPGHLAVTLAAWLGCPSLVLVRGNDFDQDWFEPGRFHFVAEALRRATVIGAVSSDLVRRIKALFPEKDVRLVPNGVDAEAWRPLPTDLAMRDDIRNRTELDGRRIIGLFGELKYKKGVKFWLEALRYAGLNDRVSLLLVGGKIDEETTQILDDPNLSPPNHRRSLVDRDELPGFYLAVDFVALPSLYDGLPNVLLEAMAMGLLPIVSDAGALGEVVKDGTTGFVFPANDQRAAAAATTRALDLSDQERLAMSRRVKAYVAENFSVEKEIDILSEIILKPIS